MDSRIPSTRELAGYSIAAQHAVTREWVSESTRIDLLARGHEVDVLLASDLTIASKRAERFAPDHPPHALLNRWVPVKDDLHAMVSMRYEGLDPAKPFVDATPLSRPLKPEDLPLLAQVAEQIYGRLRPRYVRLWSSESGEQFALAGPDRRFFAAPIQELATASDYRPPAELAITPTRSLQRYEQAKRAYEAVRAAYPQHFEQAALQDYEDLHQSMEERTLFDITVGGEWAGYIAATIGVETLGLPAYIVQEIILAPKFRGHGYGRHLNTLLARELADQSRILIGTIHANNRGAWQAAEQAGRVDIGGWIQMPLSENATDCHL